MLARLGRWCFAHRRVTLAAWLLALVGTAVITATVGSAYSSRFEIPASESASGFDLLTDEFPGQSAGRQGGTIVFRAEQGIADPDVEAAMTALLDEVATFDGVSVVSPYDPAALGQIDPSGTIAYAQVNLSDELDQMQMAEVGADIADRLPTVDGLTVEIGGQALSEFEPPKSELIGLGFAVIVLILAFGSVLAMGLPIGVALFGVGVGTAIVGLMSHLVTVPDFATTLGAMIGLAVGIDYALFIVTRYRENLHAGQSFEEATFTAMDTAGRAVVFAGITVVVSLLGMLLMGLAFVSGLGIGAASTVAVTMLASITLLPALLGFAQHRVEVTRWRGIAAAGFLAIALFGAGLAIDPLLVGIPLAVVTLLAGLVLKPLQRSCPSVVASPRARRSRTGGAESCSTTRGSPSVRASWCSAFSRRPCCRCGWASPTRATPAPTPPRAVHTTCSPPASAPASTARSWWSSTWPHQPMPRPYRPSARRWPPTPACASCHRRSPTTRRRRRRRSSRWSRRARRRTRRRSTP
ncbi:MAG: MMPL family transporter [Ilumatobacteraceae bacterium]